MQSVVSKTRKSSSTPASVPITKSLHTTADYWRKKDTSRKSKLTTTGWSASCSFLVQQWRLNTISTWKTKLKISKDSHLTRLAQSDPRISLFSSRRVLLITRMIEFTRSTIVLFPYCFSFSFVASRVQRVLVFNVLLPVLSTPSTIKNSLRLSIIGVCWYTSCWCNAV